MGKRETMVNRVNCHDMGTVWTCTLGGCGVHVCKYGVSFANLYHTCVEP